MCKTCRPTMNDDDADDAPASRASHCISYVPFGRRRRSRRVLISELASILVGRVRCACALCSRIRAPRTSSGHNDSRYTHTYARTHAGGAQTRRIYTNPKWKARVTSTKTPYTSRLAVAAGCCCWLPLLQHNKMIDCE